jgi:hypothetical protein
MRLRLLSLVLVLTAAGCAKPRADVTAIEMHQRCKDTTTGDEQFLGKSIAVRGRVESSGSSWLAPADTPTVWLGSKEAGVMCHFPPESAAEIDRLDKGDTVVIRGVCIGTVFSLPILSDCNIER